MSSTISHGAVGQETSFRRVDRFRYEQEELVEHHVAYTKVLPPSPFPPPPPPPPRNTGQKAFPVDFSTVLLGGFICLGLRALYYGKCA